MKISAYRRSGPAVVSVLGGVIICTAALASAGLSRETSSTPTLSPEFPIADAVPGAAYYYASRPAVASNETFHLVVWSEHPRGADCSRIVGTRIASDGHLLDPFGFKISDGCDAFDPSVAWSGEGFLVTWTDSVANSKGEEVVGQLLDGDGLPIDDAVIPIATGRPNAFASSVVWTGVNYLVAWTDERVDDKGDIYATMVDRQGTLIGADPVPIANGPAAQNSAHLTAGSGSTLLLWRQGQRGVRDIAGAIVAADDLERRSIDIPVADSRQPEAAVDAIWIGDAYFVVWHRPGGIHAATIDGVGTIIDRFVLARDSKNLEPGHPSVSWNGSELLLAYQPCRFFCYDGVYERFDTHGERLSSGPTHLSRGQDFSAALYPYATTNGDGYIIFSLTPTQDDPYQLNASRVSATGELLDAEPWRVSTKANSQIVGAASFDGDNFFALWRDTRRTIWDSDYFFGRLSPVGVSLDGSGIKTPERATFGVDLAWNGSVNLLVGATDPAIEGWRIGRDGVVIDKRPIRISKGGYRAFEVAVAALKDDFFVVWQQYPSLFSSPSIQGARIDAEGRVLDRFTVSRARGYQGSPAIAASEKGLLVMWTDTRESRTRRAKRYAVYGARVDPTGTVLDPEGFRIGSADWRYKQAAVASQGHDYVVLFHGIGQSPVQVAQVNEDGDVSNSVDVTGSKKRKWSVSIDRFASGYLAAWAEGPYGSGEVKAVVVDPGTLVISPPFTVSNDDDSGAPLVVPGPDGTAAVFYTRFSEQHGSVLRGYMRLVTGSPQRILPSMK
jgi:hypothetical protein